MPEKKITDPVPYMAAWSLMCGILSLVVAASYLVEDDRGWGSAAWTVLFAVLAVANLAFFLHKIVPWAVHTAERHRPTE